MCQGLPGICVIGIQPTGQALTKPSWAKIWNTNFGSFYNQDMLGLLLYVLYIVICDTILSPSGTVRCPGAIDSHVLLYVYIYIKVFFTC